jgi:tetratricopeptide (TPR) repeat protein
MAGLRREYLRARERIAAVASAGQWGDAVRAYRELLALAPQDYDAWYRLSGCLYELARYEEAGAAAREVIAAKSDHGGAHVVLGICLAELGRDEEALGAFATAERLMPEQFEPRIPLVHVLRLMQRVDYGVFRPPLRVIGLEGHNQLQHFMIAGYLRDFGRPEEALEVYCEIGRRWPREADGLKQIGVTLLALGRAEEALAAFEEFTRRFPKEIYRVREERDAARRAAKKPRAAARKKANA